MSGAAFFDLDGTLLRANSARLWVNRERKAGRVPFGQLVRATLYLVAYRLGVLDIERALQSALVSIKGASEAEIRRQTREWWETDVRPFVAPGARAVLDKHRSAREPLVLLTSSSRYASEMAHAEFGLDHVLCQGYEVKDGLFTGEPLRPICYGAGKVEIAETFARENGIDLGVSSFYSDSLTDVPMLERVAHPYAVNPDLRLKLLARRRGWPILDWA
jgi:HAD superfamily hydrolase (TIGR01490 family)